MWSFQSIHGATEREFTVDHFGLLVKNLEHIICSSILIFFSKHLKIKNGKTKKRNISKIFYLKNFAKAYYTF